MSAPVAATAVASEFTAVPIELLHPSKTNPRKHFDEKSMDDLVRSIEQHGVLVPLLVRPLDMAAFKGYIQPNAAQLYEVVAGERRLRAARKAKVKELPVRVRRMSDTEALEVQIVENLQRQDVHPLEEGEGFKVLMKQDAKKWTVEAIAAKVGKSVRYVYQRMKLTELTDPAKKLMNSGTLTAGHADLLCRLLPADQARAMDAAVRKMYGGELSVMSVRNLDAWIKENIHLNLHAAAFSKSDDKLVPAAGACTTCPKRSGNNPLLFPDVKSADVCGDPSCFHSKIQAHLVQIEKHLEKGNTGVLRIGTSYNHDKRNETWITHDKWEEVKPKSCPYAQEAIVVAGDEAIGQRKIVCAEKKCTKHTSHGNWGFVHSNRGGSDDGERYRQQEREREKRRRQEIEARRLAARKIIDQLRTLDIEGLRTVALAFFKRLHYDSQVHLGKVLGWEPQKGKYGMKSYEATAASTIPTLGIYPLYQILMGCALAGDLYVNGYSTNLTATESLAKVAKSYGVNLEKIRADVKVAAKEKKGKKTSAPAEKTAKKSKPKK